MTEKPKAYTRRQFIENYPVSMSTLKNMLRDREIEHRRRGRTVLIEVEEAERWWNSLPVVEREPS